MDDAAEAEATSPPAPRRPGAATPQHDDDAMRPSGDTPATPRRRAATPGRTRRDTPTPSRRRDATATRHGNTATQGRTRHDAIPGAGDATADDPRRSAAATRRSDADDAAPDGKSKRQTTLQQRSYSMPDWLHHEVRGAVEQTRDLAGEASSASEFVRRAVHRALVELRERHNDGQPFPAPSGRLRPGPSRDSAGWGEPEQAEEAGRAGRKKKKTPPRRE